MLAIGSIDLVSAVRARDLCLRPSREPNFAAENSALVDLIQTLTFAPGDILQSLVQAALKLCGAHSAGLSLLEDADQQKRFHWRALSGRWSHFLGGGTPRDFGPCGSVLDLNEPLLFSHPERDFPYMGDLTPSVDEGLLVPFYVRNRAIGTIWVVSHDETKRFDAEDLRVLTNLSKFAAAAYQTVLTAKANEVANEHLKEAVLTGQQYAFLVESSDDAIVSKTLDGIITSWNKGAQRIFGYSAQEAVGQHITLLMPPDKYEEEARIIECLRRGERVTPFDTVRKRKDGELIQISVTMSPMKDIDGHIIGASKIARDVTERKLAQEAQSLLMREMRHRIGNLFLVTKAIVALSARSATSPAEMAHAVEGRLSALTRAHELTRPDLIDPVGRQQETSFHDLVRAILEPYADDQSDVPTRVTITGPDLPIGEKSITNLALVLHELATNAAKYGSLSTFGAGVHVGCSLDGDSFHLIWKERGGPQVVPPSQDNGFGSVLIRQVIVSQFGGKLESDWRPDGLVVQMEIPIARLVRSTDIAP